MKIGHARFGSWPALTVLFLALTLLAAVPGKAAERRALPFAVPESARTQRLRPLDPSKRLSLAIQLPLRNTDSLTHLLQQLYSPASGNFHQFLTPDQFVESFGPLESDYKTVVNYARSNHLDIVATTGNRAVLDVAGKVSDIEKTFNIKMGVYKHSVENREFFAPDTAPTVIAGVPISGVVGLDDYTLPHPNVRDAGDPHRQSLGDIDNGSGQNGNYLGSDFRNAYIPNSSLEGAGQRVGLFEFVGYTASDVTTYESLAGLPNVPIQNVVMPGAENAPNDNENNNSEVALDIDMVIAMCPQLEKLLVVIANTGLDGMNQLAYPSNGVPLASQVSSSWGFSGSDSFDSQLMEMAAQGQSFFLASGDTGAPTNGVQSSAQDYNYATMVGGTELSMVNPGQSWKSEDAWSPSTGYIETDLAIPSYQSGVNTTANGGSSVYRNVPDVAMCADYIEIVYTHYDTNNEQFYTNQIKGVGGTSAATPLWASFIALANEQGQSQGSPTIGFLNAAIYDIAQGAYYTNCFHDITNGNNINPWSAGLFTAGRGYDNVTGLGSPNGINLINALVGLANPVFVNFNYTGTSTGAFYTPFKTLTQGVNAVSNYGTIFIETAGDSSETLSITKPMTISVLDGAATVGQ